MYRCRHFQIHELISERVFKEHGQTAWQFFDEKLLRTIDFIRHELNKPIYINDWYNLGDLEQRGLRSNIDQIVRTKTNQNKLYCSAHCYGQAADFDVQGMTAEEVRQWLILNSEGLPYSIRLEAGVNWVHLDVRDTGQKVYVFNP